jgi:hypothetical protein
VILLPSALGVCPTTEALLARVRGFIHRYVDLSPGFETVAAHYVLLTWCYEMFDALPYLRVRGHYGTGKSRFLLTVGAICFKPIFASGASTVSPLFRLLDRISGTLIIDEADFYASDERAEIVKILNNGNAKGFPVLRTEASPTKEFNPTAFNVFGPKVIATRHAFQDEALESRCLTEVLGGHSLRPEIPISLPATFEEEATGLRNQLLSYRFRQLGDAHVNAVEAPSGLEPRRAQIMGPLLRVAESSLDRSTLQEFVTRSGELFCGRLGAERDVVTAAKAAFTDTSAPLPLAAIAKHLAAVCGTKYGTDISPRWIGSVVRALGIQPTKSNGVYAITPTDFPRLAELCRQYRVGDFGDGGDRVARATLAS